MKTKAETSLKEKLTSAIEKWSEETGLRLSLPSGVSISLKSNQRPGRRIGSIKYMEDEVTGDDIRKILETNIGGESRIILEEMLKSGSREITPELIEHIAKFHDIRFITGPSKSRPGSVKPGYDVHNKAKNLNAKLTKLGLAYRVKSLRDYGAKSYCLAKVEMQDPNKRDLVKIYAEIQISGSEVKEA